MKRALIFLSVFACLCFLFGGCSEQKAEKEYNRIVSAESAGGDPQTLISEYQTLIDQHPNTASAPKARERLGALKTKMENDAKAAQLKAEQEKAEKEYKRILDAELAGGDPKALTTEYEAFIGQHPDAASATRARERLLALRTRIENEAKAAQLKAEQEERERKLRAEQEEKERAQKQKEREALEAEVKRQAKVLFEEMTQAAKDAAVKLHPDAKVTRIDPYGKPDDSEDWEKKIWTVKLVYTVRMQGFLASSYSEIIECQGEIRLNEVTKQFERVVNAKPAVAK